MNENKTFSSTQAVFYMSRESRQKFKYLENDENEKYFSLFLKGFQLPKILFYEFSFKVSVFKKQNSVITKYLKK